MINRKRSIPYRKRCTQKRTHHPRLVYQAIDAKISSNTMGLFSVIYHYLTNQKLLSIIVYRTFVLFCRKNIYEIIDIFASGKIRDTYILKKDKHMFICI